MTHMQFNCECGAEMSWSMDKDEILAWCRECPESGGRKRVIQSKNQPSDLELRLFLEKYAPRRHHRTRLPYVPMDKREIVSQYKPIAPPRGD